MITLRDYNSYLEIDDMESIKTLSIKEYFFSLEDILEFGIKWLMIKWKGKNIEGYYAKIIIIGKLVLFPHIYKLLNLEIK
jgi:hypothetical protein